MHWGLSLSGPPSDSAITAGQLASKGSCKIEDEGVVARCRIGRGLATIVADADFLKVEEPDDERLDLLIGELARLDPR